MTDRSDYRARYYDPAIGRFLSEDPIRFWGGIDFYKYVDNSPTNGKDPSGKIVLHGYWCGPDWTGGQRESYNPAHDNIYIPPRDPLDAACMRHDKCFYYCRANHPCNEGDRQACMSICNAVLINETYQIDDPDSWWIGAGISISNITGPDAGSNESCGCKQ